MIKSGWEKIEVGGRRSEVGREKKTEETFQDLMVWKN